MNKIVLFLIFILSFNVKCEYLFPTNDLVILNHNTYTIGYSKLHNQAMWCQYILTSNDLCGIKVRRTDDFRYDPLLISNNVDKIITPKMYNKTGYDKGHLCPAQDRSYSEESVSETFYMSNMSPQEPSFNRGIWKKLEEWTRNYTITNGYPVTIVTGPVIFNRHFHLDEEDTICIPHMYYKILISNCNTNCFLIPNMKYDTNILKFQVPLDYIKTLLTY